MPVGLTFSLHLLAEMCSKNAGVLLMHSWAKGQKTSPKVQFFHSSVLSPFTIVFMHKHMALFWRYGKLRGLLTPKKRPSWGKNWEMFPSRIWCFCNIASRPPARLWTVEAMLPLSIKSRDCIFAVSPQWDLISPYVFWDKTTREK